MVIKISNKYWWMLWTKYNNYKKIHIVISIAIIIHLFYIGAQNNDPCALKDPLWKKKTLCARKTFPFKLSILGR